MSERKKFIYRGLTLEYEVSGAGEPLVFLHGMGGGIEQIRGVYQETAGIRLIIPHMQGHGGSDANWAHYDFDHLGDDLLALLDTLELERANLAGISMGAAVALNAAVRYPERIRSLLLIRNAWTDRPMAPDVVQAYRDLGNCLREGGAEAFRKTKGWDIVKAPSAYTRNAFLAPFSDASSRKNWRKYQILPLKTPIPDRSVLRRLQMPVRILANRSDLCHPFEYGEWMKQAIPGSILTEIPDKDTDPEAHREEINRALREMISQNH